MDEGDLALFVLDAARALPRIELDPDDDAAAAGDGK